MRLPTNSQRVHGFLTIADRPVLTVFMIFSIGFTVFSGIFYNDRYEASNACLSSTFLGSYLPRSGSYKNMHIIVIAIRP